MPIRKIFFLLTFFIPLFFSPFFSMAEEGPASFNVWPFFHTISDPEERLDEMEGIGPFLYWKKSSDQNHWGVRPLLYRLDEEKASHQRLEFCYPLGKYEKQGEDRKAYLFPITVYRVQVFNGDRKWNFQFVTLFMGETEKRKSYYGLFPFYGTLLERFGRDEIRFILWPLYGKTVKEDVCKTNLVWPFFSLTQGEKKEGFRFWPLYGKLEEFGVSKKAFFLWPVFHKTTQGLDTEDPIEGRAIFPVYISKESRYFKSKTYLWPLFTYARNSQTGFEQLDFPWPFFRTVKGENLYGIRFLPFYGFKERGEDSKRIFVILPVYQFQKDRMGDTWETTHRIFLLWRIRTNEMPQGDQTGKSLRIWPFFDYEKEETGYKKFSFLYLFPFKDDGFERNLFPLFRIFRWEKNLEGRKSTNLLWGLYQRIEREDSDFWEIAYLIRVKKGTGRKTVSFLQGLIQYQKEGEGRRLKLFYLPLTLRSHRSDDLKFNEKEFADE